MTHVKWITNTSTRQIIWAYLLLYKLIHPFFLYSTLYDLETFATSDRTICVASRDDGALPSTSYWLQK